MNGSREPMFKPTFTPTIELGHILQAGAMVAMGFGAYYALLGKTDEANRKVDDLKVVVTETRAEVKAGFDGLQRQISNLPDVSARVTLLEHGVATLQAQQAATEKRSIETAATVENIVRSASAPLGMRHQ